MKILAIDDNEMNLIMLQGLLKKTGVQIDAVHSGEEGLIKAGSIQYDLILLDHMMPEMDGVETLQKLKQIMHMKEKKTPVIALTANMDAGAKEEYLEKGFTDYIGKPIEYRILINLLKKYVSDEIEMYPDRKKEEMAGEKYLQQQGLHVKAAMKYAGGEWKQYIRLLKLFADDKSCKRQETLQQAYEAWSWKDYTIYVHGLKNEARTIGADTLADMAYAHEQKSKEGDIAFVQENYPSLMQEWEKTRESIRFYLKHQGKEKMPLDGVTKAEMTQDERKEMLEQAIRYLGEYKKNEAALLLQKLLQGELAEEVRNHVECALRAVQEYDYEYAVHRLREI